MRQTPGWPVHHSGQSSPLGRPSHGSCQCTPSRPNIWTWPLVVVTWAPGPCLSWTLGWIRAGWIAGHWWVAGGGPELTSWPVDLSRMDSWRWVVVMAGHCGHRWTRWIRAWLDSWTRWGSEPGWIRAGVVWFIWNRMTHGYWQEKTCMMETNNIILYFNYKTVDAML